MSATITEEAATFLLRLEELYERVETWIRAMDPGAVFSPRGSISINEEETGEYDAPTLTIRMSSGDDLHVLPVGCNIMDAAARVRIYCIGWETVDYLEREPTLTIGTGDRARTLSLREQTGLGWVWIRDRLKHDIPPLDESAFRDLVRRAIR